MLSWYRYLPIICIKRGIIKNKSKRAFSLIELIIVLLLLVILSGVAVNMYSTGLRVWNEGYNRADIRTQALQAFELISKNLRQASVINALTQSSITFTADLGAGSDTYRVYLYNAADPEPNPPYTQSSYELRWSRNDLSYGAGARLIQDVQQPSNIPFVQNGNLITLDLTVSRGSESVRLRSNVRPRNL